MRARVGRGADRQEDADVGGEEDPRPPLRLLQVRERRDQPAADLQGRPEGGRGPQGGGLRGGQHPGLHVARGPARPVADGGRRATRRSPCGGPRRRKELAGRRPDLGAQGRRAAPARLREPRTGPRARARARRSRTTSSSLWESDPDVAEQKTPAAEKRVAAASGRHAKAEVIYEYLRRARIDLEKTEKREWVDRRRPCRAIRSPRRATARPTCSTSPRPPGSRPACSARRLP